MDFSYFKLLFGYLMKLLLLVKDLFVLYNLYFVLEIGCGLDVLLNVYV